MTRYQVAKSGGQFRQWLVVDTVTAETIDSYNTRAEAVYYAAQMNEAQRRREGNGEAHRE